MKAPPHASPTFGAAGKRSSGGVHSRSRVVVLSGVSTTVRAKVTNAPAGRRS